MQKNSILGIISFIWLVCGFMLLIPVSFGTHLEKYVYHNSFGFTGNILPLLDIGLIISFAGCLITGVVASFKKDTKKTLSTISLSALASVSLLLLLAVLPPALFSENVAYGVVTNYGIFDIPSVKLKNGVKKTLYEERFLKSNTKEIPAVLGTRFGFNYVIEGEPDDEEVFIKRIIRYPQPGMITGGKARLADTSAYYVSLNKLRFFGFLFERDYELVEGLWQIEFYYGGKKLFSQDFHIIKGNKYSI